MLPRGPKMQKGYMFGWSGALKCNMGCIFCCPGSPKCSELPENLVTDVRDLIDWWWGGLAQATDPEPGSRAPASRGHGRYGTVPGPISDQFAEVGGERIEGKGKGG